MLMQRGMKCDLQSGELKIINFIGAGGQGGV